MKHALGVITVSSLIFFLSWLFVYKIGINTLAIQSEDTLPAIFLPITILKEGTFYADSYYQMIIQKYPHPDDKNYQKGLAPFYFKKIQPEDSTTTCVGESCVLNSHYISAFPLMVGLLSLLVYIVPVLAGLTITWENLILLSHLAAALITALSGGFFYLLSKKFVDEKQSVLLTAIYLFGTVNFAMVSQSLWQHGAVELFTILSLLLLFSSRALGNSISHVEDGGNLRLTSTGSLWNLAGAGLFMGLAILSRPTAGILLPYFVLLAIYLWNKDLMASPLSAGSLTAVVKTKLVFLVGLLPALGFFVWYNAVYFGSILNQGYSDQVGVNWLTPFPLGFLGLWLSPSKGLLIYSPIFVFSIAGVYLALKKGGWRQNLIYLVFLSIVLTHTLILGAWKHWYGGYSFGYRMASDIIPFLVLLLIPYLKSTLYHRTKNIFYCVILLSVLIELMGLAFFDGIWHGTYDRGFWDQAWLWSIQNSEIVFNIRRLLVKLSL